MDMLSIYIANGVGIFILLILLYASQTRIKRWHTEDKIYLAMVLGVMLGCCMEAFSYTIDGNVFTGSRVLNYIANTYLFTANLLLPFCVEAVGWLQGGWQSGVPSTFSCVVLLMLSALTCAWEPGSATSTWFIFAPEQLSLRMLGIFLLRNL